MQVANRSNNLPAEKSLCPVGFPEKQTDALHFYMRGAIPFQEDRFQFGNLSGNPANVSIHSHMEFNAIGNAL
jgi:hypothetical protein